MSLVPLQLTARQKHEKEAVQYGMGLIVNLPLPEAEVEQAVQEVVQSGIIRGTKEYNKDEFVSGASPASASKAFPEWSAGGTVLYKERREALDPRNFKDSGDVGTLAVRYVLQEQGGKNTILRIDAIFVEDFRRTVHASNGSVETAEYKDIQDHLEAAQLLKKQTAEALREKAALRDRKGSRSESPSSSKGQSSSRPESSALQPQPVALAAPAVPAAPGAALPDSTVVVTTPPGTPEPAPPHSLEQHVRDLRRQVERIVKAPGAPLKSAPFHSASTLTALPAGEEVLIVISTPYWLGVETHSGQHGWIPRDQLELLP